MFQIYRKAARYWWSSLPALLLAAAALVAVDRLHSGVNGTLSTLGLSIFVVWYFHRHFLFHEAPMTLGRNPSHKVKRPFFAFVLVSLALLLIPLAIAIAIAGALVPNDSKAMIGATFLLLCPLYLLAFSFFATALPASIERDPRYSLVAGMRQAPRLAGLILIGPVLTTIVLTACAVLAKHALPATVVTPWIALAADILAQTLNFFVSTVAAASFCHVYRRIVPEAEAPMTPA